LACCVRAVKRAGIQPSDVVVVVGLGSIGLLFMDRSAIHAIDPPRGW